MNLDDLTDGLRKLRSAPLRTGLLLALLLAMILGATYLNEFVKKKAQLHAVGQTDDPAPEPQSDPYDTEFVLNVPKASASADRYTRMMRSYFDSVFPSEDFEPTPYGAGSRFQPKTIWAYLKSARMSPSDPGGKSWFALSSGAALFPAEQVPTHRESIALPTTESTAETKWALLATMIGGNTEQFDRAAEAQVAAKSASVFRLKFGSAEIEYCYYADLTLAYRENKGSLRQFADRFTTGQVKSPLIRVITAAVRARDVSVSTDTEEELDLLLRSGAGIFSEF